ncbi:MAG TPA: 30S ribosome-binding factor RbfA [Firmicutes bacterium]|nr:30S ribosome-binding factor RbfA [Bacillota bacterium]
MAGGTRVERLADRARLEIADILRKMKDPRIGFVSVTEVEASPDLRHLKVFVSIMGSEEERQRTMEALEHARGYIRTELGGRIQLRYTPEVVFKYDPSLARGSRVIELLSQLHGEPEEGGKPPEEGS